MFSAFLPSYRNTSEGLGKLEKRCGHTHLLDCVPIGFLTLPNFHLCLDNLGNMFSILKQCNLLECHSLYLENKDLNNSRM